jgi:hypothetical protein
MPAEMPHFNPQGLLAHDFELTFEQLEASMLVLGPKRTPWDEDRRHKLVRCARVLVEHLWAVGIDEVYLDGSFVEKKASPNDIDGYFVVNARHFYMEQFDRLQALDRCWTWDPVTLRPAADTAKPQLPMWHKYRVELYPHYRELTTSGIKGSAGEDIPFPEAFRRRRGDFMPKGLVRIVRPELE